MVTPLGLITRAVRSPRPRLTPAIGRCPVCGDAIRGADGTLTLRGGIHVHRGCATYRIRQRAQRGRAILWAPARQGPRNGRARAPPERERPGPDGPALSHVLRRERVTTASRPSA